MKHIILVILTCIGLTVKAQQTDVIMQMNPIERMCFLIRHFEGWHINKGQYIGWGHRLQPGENLTQNITRAQGDSLLYEDLLRLVNHYKGYGDKALLLACLAYNVGQGHIDGNKTHPPSKLIRKIKSGCKDFKADYLDFCRVNGRPISSIKRRRWAEYHYLYLNLNY